MKISGEPLGNQIRKAIIAWSDSYEELERLQKLEPQNLLPKHSDQKTGMIGEFWSIIYLTKSNKKSR